jgi:hypothetical protein
VLDGPNETMMERLEDIELNAIVDARRGEARLKVDLDESARRCPSR